MFTTLPTADVQVGKPIDQELMQLIKDNFDDLNTRMTSLVSGTIPNGSFEVDSDNDGVPDNWTFSPYSGGSLAYDTTTPSHGAKAIRITQTTASGGGLLDSDYIPCSEHCYVNIRAMHKASAAGMDNRIQLSYYSATKSYISTVSAYASTANPTSWTEIIATLLPVANARFLKVRIVGGSPGATTGIAYWDNLVVNALRLDNFVAQTSGSMLYNQSGSSLSVGSKTVTAYGDSATAMDVDRVGGAAITATINGCAKTCSITPPAGRWTAIAFGSWIDGWVDADEGQHAGSWNIILLLIRQA